MTKPSAIPARFLWVCWIFFQLLLISCTKTGNSDQPVPPITPGPPASRPVDSADMIYIGGRLNDLYAIKANTGQIVWKRNIPGTYGMPPVYTQGIIAMRGYDGYMTAFDTAGNKLWSIPPMGGDPGPSEFVPVADNGIIYSQDYYKIYAIHATDGSIKWSYDKHDFQGNGSAGLVVQGNGVFTTDRAGDYIGLDINTGAELWKTYTNITAWDLVVQNGLVYAIGGNGSDGNFKMLDAKTGGIKYAAVHPNGYTFNIGYGKIYHVDGSVYDTASQASPLMVNPIVQVPLLPFGSSYPILADSMVILTTGIFDAISGQLVCYPLNVDVGVYLSGASYVGGVLFYSGGQREVYDPWTGGHWYSDVYAYDVRGNKLIWRTEAENADLVETEPVVVTKSGAVYKGIRVTR